MNYIYANILGVWVFNDQFEVEDKLLFSEDDYSRILKLENGKLIDEEKQLAEKYDGKIVGNSTGYGLGKSNGKSYVPLKILAYFREKKFLNEIKSKTLRLVKKKISEDVKKDALIVQAMNQIDELDKIMNNLGKRLREWYGLYNPEFERTISDHEKFAEILLKKSKEELLRELNIELSMGIDLNNNDLLALRRVAQQLIELGKLKEDQKEYVDELMKKEAPNVLAICGPMIGGKLVSLAGGLEKLSLFPASTIQLLGAEKALFRHIKTGARCPKYGILINHPFVTGAKKDIKARAARLLADKISIAVKVDYFKGEFIGDKLKKEIQDKLKLEN
ncbi:hypothetical protein HOK51_06440 [Candidatus Woesearchaeota archaeon]|jgi:nucleolar protein 56|nr:hypothetical protein [Candidatus Woesearchaeota archaeon]MBT6519462.1 hypothetical protein [Candidatus Woesearchaeota archaeon]